MSLLPKTSQEFAKEEYWNAFFKKRGDKAFEWYGEYLEICDQVHKYCKFSDKILMLGCGNSKLSMDMYDSGYRNIINIDISAVAIRKMLGKNKKARPEMQFLEMDATEMSFENESFSVALDKGTLDALFVDETAEVVANVERYLNEVARIMRNSARYLCITLLQEHILKYVVQYFARNSFMLRITHLPNVERANREKNPDAIAMPVFMVVATKAKGLSLKIFEFSLDGETIKRVGTAEELINAVQSVQNAAFVCNGLVRSNIVGYKEVRLDLHQVGEDTPRYVLFVLDQERQPNMQKYAAFIVPCGREVEWLFGTTEGRKKLHKNTNYERIVVVTMNRDQKYESLEAIKLELNANIRSLAPAGCENIIPFLSVGNDMGNRQTLVTGQSKISGGFRIEEVEYEDGRVFRRLIFLSNQFVVQSEALVKTIKAKNPKKERKIVDISYMACMHHLYMAVGTQMIASQAALLRDEQQYIDVLVVGLGGGGLCSFMQKAFANVRVTAVEIDPIMLEIAEQYFDLKQDERMIVVIDDGLEFLKKCRTNDINFHVVLFDVDSKDASLGLSCPPPSFLEAEVMQRVKDIIGLDGIFVLNFVCRDESLRESTVQQLRDMFHSIACYRMEEDVNEIIFCSNNMDRYPGAAAWRELLGTAGKTLSERINKPDMFSEDLNNITGFLLEMP